MVCVAAVALGSSTYAWFVTNNNVKADNMTVMANSDVEFLEIANVGTNFDGKTIAVNADNSGANLKLNPVTLQILPERYAYSEISGTSILI